LLQHHNNYREIQAGQQYKLSRWLFQFFPGATKTPVFTLEWGGLHTLVTVDSFVLFVHQFVLILFSGIENFEALKMGWCGGAT